MEGGRNVEEVVVHFPVEGAREVGAVAFDSDFGDEPGGSIDVGAVE